MYRITDIHQEDEPNTPSKSKMLPRKPWTVYATLILLACVTGFLLLQRDASGSRSSSYRKVLIDKMHIPRDQATADGLESPPTASSFIARNAENSEARQREALEIADKILHLPNSEQQQLGELSAGGGSLTAQPVIVNPVDDPEHHDGTDTTTDSNTSSQTPTTGDSPDAIAAVAPAENAAGAEQPSTVVVSQIFTNGENRDLVVDASRIAFLEVMSKGLESEDLENPGPLHQMWWSNIISTSGDRAPPVSRPTVGHTAAMATSLTNSDAPTTSDDEQCKIHVLDVGTNLGPSLGARPCDLSYKRVWPFSRHKFGIDGVETLQPEDYQYATEHWISESIRNSSRYVGSIEEADFVFVDMWCYHTAWMAYIHPLGNRNTTNPEPYMRRTLNAIVKMDKFTESKGGSFAIVHPNPIMKGLFSEEAMCEDLASVFNMVPEHSNLCVWTQDSPQQGKSIILPYVASLDLDFETDLLNNPRDTLLFFRGGCGHPDPSIRGLFAAGKMLRYEMVSSLTELSNNDDIDVECSCDICDNHMPHPQLQAAYRNAKFCPVLPSNVQSSRRLSEVILNGCIPVFLGPPFHTLPLANDVDYASMGIFINITQSSTWINDTSSNYLQNHMVMRVWRLDDPSIEEQMVHVESLEAAVEYLRSLPEDVVLAKRKSVLDQRYKFYYGAVPEVAGGDGKTSALGELLMKHMCRRAAIIKRRMNKAKEQGVDLIDSDVQIRHASLAHGDQKSFSVWSSFFKNN